MPERLICTLCGREGHYPKDCPLRPAIFGYTVDDADKIDFVKRIIEVTLERFKHGPRS
jgi:hypothetical protein